MVRVLQIPHAPHKPPATALPYESFTLIPADHDPRHAVLLTPVGRGAVATVLVEGADAVEAVGRWFRPASGRPLAEIPLGRIAFGCWGDRSGAGEELVLCRRSQAQIEVHCHGGTAAAENVLASLAEAGFPTLDWRDWTRKAETDPLAAEARVALAAARTERAARMLLDQYQGALGAAIERAAVACERGDAQVATGELAQLLRYERLGRHLVEPWRVVLAGPPNVGKSSLINALLGFERSIVFDQPGTTRDVLTAHSALDGWPVELADTAGLRSGGDEIEEQGVAKARERLASADLVLLVFDASQARSREDQVLAASVPEALLVYNKCDLIDEATLQRPSGLFASALMGAGMEALLNAVVARLVPEAPPPGAAVPFTSEQADVLRTALAEVTRGELRAAAGRLRTITR